MSQLARKGIFGMSVERLNQELDAVEERLVQDVSAEPDAKRRAELYRALTTYAEARAQLAQIMPYLPETPLEEAPSIKEVSAQVETPTPLYTIPQTALLLGLPRNLPLSWIRTGLLKKDIHFIETGGEARVQRGITEQGLARMRKINEAKADFWRMPAQKVLAKLKEEEPTAEQEPAKFYTIPQSAERVNFGRNTIYGYISSGLLKEGVHFIETSGTQRTQRRITEAGLEILMQIEKIRGGKKLLMRTIRRRLAATEAAPTEKRPSTTELVRETLFSRPGRVTKAQAIADQLEITAKAVHNAVRKLKNQVDGHRIVGTQFGYLVRPETEHIPPEKINFSEEETLKLAHRLSDAAARLQETYSVRISDQVRQLWSLFIESGGTLQNPEAAVRSLERKLLSLVQDPATELPRFSENYPVEEVLMLMYQLDLGQRRPFLKSLLYPKNHTFVARWGQPLEKPKREQ